MELCHLNSSFYHSTNLIKIMCQNITFVIFPEDDSPPQSVGNLEILKGRTATALLWCSHLKSSVTNFNRKNKEK